jgi:hypothetical protein
MIDTASFYNNEVGTGIILPWYEDKSNPSKSKTL